jgi:hypothetical protein
MSRHQQAHENEFGDDSWRVLHLPTLQA